MTNQPRTLPFFLDFISPYSYLAWVYLRRQESALHVELVPKPVLFAALLNAHGTLGPAEVEAKRRYVFIDTLRKSALLDIPLNAPFGHPFNPLLPLRLALASSDDERPRLVDQLYRATWEFGVEVSDSTAVREFLQSRFPAMDLASLWTRAHSPEVKVALRTQTEQAVSMGIFGVPSVLLSAELYWGIDSIEALEAVLRGTELVSTERRKGWQNVKPLSQRRR